jgi:hypothetical protein
LGSEVAIYTGILFFKDVDGLFSPFMASFAVLQSSLDHLLVSQICPSFFGFVHVDTTMTKSAVKSNSNIDFYRGISVSKYH